MSSSSRCSACSWPPTPGRANPYRGTNFLAGIPGNVSTHERKENQNDPRNSLAGISPIGGLRPLVALLLAVSVLSSGCVSMQSVSPPVPGRSQTVAVKIGDKVEVQTKSGEKLAFTVTAIEPEALIGKAREAVHETRVRYEDIARLQVARVDTLRTAGVVVVTVVILAGVIVAASGGSCPDGEDSLPAPGEKGRCAPT